MVKSLKSMESDQARDQAIHKFCQIILYLYQKDVFYAHYIRFLAKRLLTQQHKKAQKYENDLIGELQKDGGGALNTNLNKIKEMVEDIKTSNDLTKEFVKAQ